MGEYTSKISELNPLSGGNMAGEVPISLNLDSGTLATNKLSLSQIRDLFDFDRSFEDIAEGIAQSVEGQLFYVYADNTKLSVNEYIRTKTGASAVVNASGTAKVIYIPAILKHIKVQVESFEELRAFRPWWEGQVVYLKGYYKDGVTGSGEFVSHFGTGVDDGGVIAAGTGYWWERNIDSVVTPEMFGAILDSRRNVPGTDCTVAINKCFRFAIVNEKTVSFQSTTLGSVNDELGYYVTSPINATGIHSLDGNVLFHVKSSIFDTSEFGYVFLLGDPKTDAKTIQNALIFKTISIRDLDKRAKELSGIYLKYTGAYGLYLRGIDLNGSGVELAPVFDSQFAVIVERCGNVTKPSLYTNGNGDECNSIVFTYILCHDAYHKGIYIAGSKIKIVNIHAEANTVLTDNDGYTGLTGVNTSSGLKYVNHLFYIIAGEVGNCNFNDYGNTDKKTYYDDQNTLNSTLGTHVAFALVKTPCTNITNEIVTSNGGNVGRVSLFTANSFSEITEMSVGHLYVEASARVSINSITNMYLYSWSDYLTIRGGVVYNFGPRMKCSFSDSRIDANNPIDNSSWIKATRCSFPNGISQLTPSQKNKFDNCNITGISLSVTNQAEFGNFDNCDIGSATGISVSGGTSVNPKEVVIKNSVLRNKLQNTTSNDAIRLIGNTNIPAVSFSLGNFSLPSYTRPGTVVQTIKSSYSAGDVITSLCLTVASDGTCTWKSVLTV